MKKKEIRVYLIQYADRPHYLLQWTDPRTGKRKTESTGTDDRKKAEQIREDRASDLRHGRYSEAGAMLWSLFRETYDNEQLSAKKENTQAKADYIFDSFERLASPRTIGDIDARMISEYASRLRLNGLRPATICGHLAYLKSALRWAMDQELIVKVPKIVMPKISKGTLKEKVQAAARITQEEFERLLMKSPTEGWRLLLSFVWYCGMRRTEARSVKGQHVDLQAHQIAIPENKAGDKAATVFITPELDRILRDHWPTARFPAEHLVTDVPSDCYEVTKQFKRIARKAAVKGNGKPEGWCTLHDLRRAFGSRWAAKVPAQVLQRMMRHSDIKTTLTYYADTDKAALELLWPENPTLQHSVQHSAKKPAKSKLHLSTQVLMG